MTSFWKITTVGPKFTPYPWSRETVKIATFISLGLSGWVVHLPFEVKTVVFTWVNFYREGNVKRMVVQLESHLFHTNHHLHPKLFCKTKWKVNLCAIHSLIFLYRTKCCVWFCLMHCFSSEKYYCLCWCWNVHVQVPHTLPEHVLSEIEFHPKCLKKFKTKSQSFLCYSARIIRNLVHSNVFSSFVGLN